jgi:hypothetical protein
MKTSAMFVNLLKNTSMFSKTKTHFSQNIEQTIQFQNTKYSKKNKIKYKTLFKK